ncbi:unnamed protein product [Heligmosomoides polygyrus]|uniref:Uncharacterized protein n=1 Tax=Heligmosomoides polygyrus TaxID=6339 RepID=A0A183GCP2_HELPZ|nr:unnamed protein product [Heligmosomoides polygyrus]
MPRRRAWLLQPVSGEQTGTSPAQNKGGDGGGSGGRARRILRCLSAANKGPTATKSRRRQKNFPCEHSAKTGSSVPFAEQNA